MTLAFSNPFRPRKDNEHSLKIPALIVAGTAACALLVATADAAGNRSVRHAGAAGNVAGHRIVKHKTVAGKASKSAKKTTTVVKVKPVPSQSRIVPYIYVPVPPNTAPPSVDPNGCVDSGTGCTDEQLCDFWGMNCNSLPPMVQPNPVAASGISATTDPTAG